MCELNHSRIYLQVFFVSDLADVSGVHVEAWATKGKQSETRTSKWEWLLQQRPVKWVAWKKVLDYIGPDWYWNNPWGTGWWHRVIKWYMECESHVLYYQDKQRWRVHPSTRASRLCDTSGGHDHTSQLSGGERPTKMQWSGIIAPQKRPYIYIRDWMSAGGLTEQYTMIDGGLTRQDRTTLGENTASSLLTGPCYSAWVTTAGS
jgi:hypothetical protein